MMEIRCQDIQFQADVFNLMGWIKKRGVTLYRAHSVISASVVLLTNFSVNKTSKSTLTL